jgi:beta-mannosidase
MRNDPRLRFAPFALTLPIVLAASRGARASPQGEALFSADFADGAAGEWRTIGGPWQVKDGIFSPADANVADPRKALVACGDERQLASEVVVTAKLRVDGGWKSDSRAGIAVASDPATGRGLNLVFHDGKVGWLQDFVTWGPAIDYAFEPGRWYWMELYQRAGDASGRAWIDEGREPPVLKGKVWRDGEVEPADWMTWWVGFQEPASGLPGLTADAQGASVSFASFAVRKAARSEPVHLDATTISLDGIWQVRPEALDCIGVAGLAKAAATSGTSVATPPADDVGWIPAQVPGEIHLDLMRAGRMADPSFGANMPNCRWPETKSWWYRTNFAVGADFLPHERQELVFDGLDLYAQVFLNGALVGESADAFVPVRFDVGPFLRVGRNELVVRMTAGSELSHDPAAAGGSIPNPGRRGWDGRRDLRKPQFSYGWDWVDALPNIGIWRSVHLEGRRHAVIHDLRVDTIREEGRVALELDASVENLDRRGGRACVLELEITPPGSTPLVHHSPILKAPILRNYAIDLPPGLQPVRDRIEIPDAQLWWPNGMGGQPLYRVSARVTNGLGATFDRRDFSIGLRTVELDRSRQAKGSRFCFRVNGRDVFCRGGNIGPQDAILARITDDKYRQLVAEARAANMNMIRINGCSIYEGAAFYDACDRAGILVWHDFMLTDTTYPEKDPAFVAAVRSETESIVKLLRHHPSIALWSGNNENTWLFSRAPNYGEALYNRVLPELCFAEDPRRPYWPGSPAGGTDPNSELIGDCHWWGAYAGDDMERRIRPEVFDDCRARFISEYGVTGPCCVDSMREYLAPDQMAITHPTFQTHVNEYERKLGNPMLAGIRRHYADPERLSLAEYSLYGQCFQAAMHGSAIEAMRFRKLDRDDDCEGVLMWSYSDCWGETGWSILDWQLRRKASWYATRRACAPVKVVVRRRGDRFVTRVVNDTLQPFEGSVEAGWWRLDGSLREVESVRVEVAADGADGVVELASTMGAIGGAHDAAQWLYAAVLHDQSGAVVDQSVQLLAPFRTLQRVAPRIAVEPLASGELDLVSSVFAHAVHVEDHGRALLSDNWFDLLPGVRKRVRVAAEAEAAARAGDLHFEAVAPKEP